MPINATVGSDIANCYVTLSEAIIYFSDRAHADDWESLDDTMKSKLLITSSYQLDWYMPWKGTKTYETQSMGWPRTDVVGKDGTEYDSTTIPAVVKRAVYELALVSIEKDRMADQDLDGISEVQAGPLRLKTDTTVYAKKFAAVPDNIKKLLSDVTVANTIGVIRLMRA